MTLTVLKGQRVLSIKEQNKVRRRRKRENKKEDNSAKEIVETMGVRHDSPSSLYVPTSPGEQRRSLQGD
jgi:hypothetical protein